MTNRQALTAARQHGLTRAEWEAQFTARIGHQLQLAGAELEHVAAAELESWPDDGPSADWHDEGPAAAADDNLSNWSE
jgi:chitodextrinase